MAKKCGGTEIVVKRDTFGTYYGLAGDMSFCLTQKNWAFLTGLPYIRKGRSKTFRFKKLPGGFQLLPK